MSLESSNLLLGEKLFWIDSQGQAIENITRKDGTIKIPPLDQFYWRTEDTNELYIDLCVVDEDRDLLIVGRLFTDGRIQML